MADESAYASRHDNKRRLDDSPTAPWPARRPSGFSSPPADAQSATPQSYNSVPPPPDGIQLAKQRAQEIAAKLFSEAGAKRPKVDNGAGDESGDKGFGSGPSDFLQKPMGQQFATQGGLTSPASFPSYGFQSSSKKIEIPNGRVGVIIGKGGETIKYLQLQSGAKIQVTRDADSDPSSQTRNVELMGTAEQISKAEQLIKEVIDEADAGASGTASARKYGGPQVGVDHFTMKVPNNKVGLIIGKGGETIKSMQAKSGARIQLIPLHLPPGDTSTERNLHIDGTPEQIESAKQLVSEITKSCQESINGRLSSTVWCSPSSKLGSTRATPYAAAWLWLHATRNLPRTASSVRHPNPRMVVIHLHLHREDTLLAGINLLIHQLNKLQREAAMSITIRGTLLLLRITTVVITMGSHLPPTTLRGHMVMLTPSQLVLGNNQTKGRTAILVVIKLLHHNLDTLSQCQVHTLVMINKDMVPPLLMEARLLTQFPMDLLPHMVLRVELLMFLQLMFRLFSNQVPTQVGFLLHKLDMAFRHLLLKPDMLA
ncbi:hypothetical protein J5N97_025734 [Dioscorea zingiberensis]|uniref:K Homology domain-containing protein n=1 Tax=Dioscorea zingiberensis TaxID=325984 RepID=A0A9D5C0V0_9LILI|nr:hypothetical protein J5N97_025734 [Dioscorea zingiberensis]